MKLISWNVNGLRSILSRGLVAWAKEENPSIICLQETKISSDLRSVVAPLEDICSSVYLSYAKKRGYSGVATCVLDQRLCPKEEAVTSLDNGAATTCEDEGRILITEHQSFTLYNIYFPSGTTGEDRQEVKYEFLNVIYEHLSSLSARNRGRIIICGDFNICHRDIDIHHPREAEKRRLSGFLPEERAWMDKFSTLGFTDSFRHLHPETPQSYSWWTYRAGARAKNLGWRIDYFFVGAKLISKLANAGIYSHTVGSDHCPIFLELSL